MRKHLLLLPVLAVLLMTGCAQKVKIKALKPAEVGAMANKKKVAVMDFRNDKVGLSGKIQAQIAKHELDKKRYFTLLSRKDVDKVIAEQKLQSSEMLDQKTSVKVGKLLGAQALITGRVDSATAESGSYKQPVQQCAAYNKDGKCTYYRTVYKTCQTTDAAVSGSITIVDMETAQVIYGDNPTKTYSGDTCKGFFGSKVLSKQQAIDHLAKQIANEFVYKLTPNYVYFHVTLIEDIDNPAATSQDKEQLGHALEYIKAGRMDKAESIMQQIMDRLDGQSYALAYDLGVVMEAQGKFDEAKKLYGMADELTMQPVEEINLAINRINKLIADRDEAASQMAKK
jgi:hypothetical protein